MRINLIIIIAISWILTGCGGGSNSIGNSTTTPTASSYTLGGTITSASGVSPSGLVLSDGTDTLTITNSANTFTFPTSVSSSTAYTVNIKTNPVGVNCNITNGTGTGTMPVSNVNSITVNCVAGSESIIHNFTNALIANSNPQQTDGATSYGGLIMDSSGNFFGTTEIGGTNNFGTIFEITSSGDYIVLYSFAGVSIGDGANPMGRLVIDNSGNLFGTTRIGGFYNNGTIFELAKTANGYVYNSTTNNNYSILYSFTGGTGDGANPHSGLVIDAAGNLYGTTIFGGIGTNGQFTGNGIVFELANTANGYIWDFAANNNYTVLYKFLGGTGDGANPNAGLVMDTAGNLYGTTSYGGIGTTTSILTGNGIVFELAKTTNGYVYNSSTNNNYTILYSFTGGTGDGANPYSSLIIDSSGNLYGTTLSGGRFRNGYGVIFELANTANGYVYNSSTNNNYSVLYKFLGGTSDGANPGAALVTDAAGNLYGTTVFGGIGATTSVLTGNGIVFELAKTANGYVYNSSTNNNYSILYSFTGGTGDGANPHSRLIIDSSGNLYGTTSSGGAANAGTVFKIN